MLRQVNYLLRQISNLLLIHKKNVLFKKCSHSSFGIPILIPRLINEIVQILTTFKLTNGQIKKAFISILLITISLLE